MATSRVIEARARVMRRLEVAKRSGVVEEWGREAGRWRVTLRGYSPRLYNLAEVDALTLALEASAEPEWPPARAVLGALAGGADPLTLSPQEAREVVTLLEAVQAGEEVGASSPRAALLARLRGARP